MEPSIIPNKLLTPSVCRCCLADDCFKDISTEYFWMGKREVYAEMLLEAFNINLSHTKSEDLSNTSRLICEQCITRLRDASAFKQQVIHCEQTLQDQLVIQISEIPSTSDPLEDLKKETQENEDGKIVFEIAPDENDDEYDDGDNEPLTNFTSSPSKNNTSIIKSETTSKLAEKRPNSSVLIPPPIKRIRIPEMIKETTKSLNTVKRVMAKAPPGKVQPKTGMLDKKAMNQQLVSKLKKIGLLQAGSNKSVGRQLPRLMVKQPNVASKGPVKTLHLGGKIVVKKQIGYPSVKPSTSATKLAVKPKKENESNSSRMNTEIIIRNTTAYPFKIPEDEMMCVYCGDTIPIPLTYRKHMEGEHPTANLKGKLTFLTASAGNVKVDISDLQCRICFEDFKDLDKIAHHLNDAHKQKLNFNYDLGVQPFKFLSESLICAVCDQKFCSIRALSRHTQSHFSKFPCDICGKLYSTMHNLKHHVSSLHMSHEIKCVRCKETFASKEAKRRHLEDSAYCRPHACNFCGEKFVLWNTKQAHISDVHEQFSLRCRECDQSFTNKIAFQKHFRRYHDSNNSCSLCGRGFRDKAGLADHMIVHTKEKKYQCAICQNLFSRRGALVQHMIIHSEDKKLVCKVCGKKFNQRVTWKSHIKSYHPDYVDFLIQKIF